MVFRVVWLAVAVFGAVFVAMGRRVYVDEDWEDGQWWGFESFFALRGHLFIWLFPATRGPHTRRHERTNAMLVMLWGLALVALGLLMAAYEMR